MPENESHDLGWDDPLVKQFQLWSQMREEVEKLTAQLNGIRSECMSAIEDRGYRDHKGSQYLKLPFPVGAKGYSSIKRERRVSTRVSEEAAESITRERGVYDACFPATPRLDADELFRQYQRGKLTQEDMDAIFLRDEVFSFRPTT